MDTENLYQAPPLLHRDPMHVGLYDPRRTASPVVRRRLRSEPKHGAASYGQLQVTDLASDSTKRFPLLAGPSLVSWWGTVGVSSRGLPRGTSKFILANRTVFRRKRNLVEGPSDRGHLVDHR